MTLRRVSYEETLGYLRQHKGRKYPSREDLRMRGQMVFPLIDPTFCLEQGEAVFTIGSCFARNIEEALVKLGMDVPSLAYTVPLSEAPGRTNRILNQYNAGTMSEIVKFTLSDGEIRGGVYQTSEGMYGDALLSSAVLYPVTMERIIERRAEVVNLYRTGLQASTTVVITLGLVEAWFDLEDQVYLNDFPTRKIANDMPKRFELRRLGVEENLTLLSGMLEQLTSDRKRNVILTVSPVPFGSTMVRDDAVIANGYSKSVLRVVAEELAARYDFVDYFPSYEMVTSSGFQNYIKDQIHVRPETVERVVAYMIERYTSANDASGVADATL